jgi:cell division protein ZapA
MCKIRDAGKVRARDRIAVLAALNLAFDLSDKPDSTAAPASDKTGAEPSPARSEDNTSDSDLLLTSLLERLDEALGEDGQLL